ncbi:ATP-binding protein [Treponema sp. OMZ 792]|uniref:ATP-binding protein n=1 Tax=unclassified Treponema TaxID=2638727 RepID=UPI0020A3F8BE|nr:MULTISPECIES: ATP-binding protein [unclassified Treponema]UTC75209.1 ATP-binding protein [Treponema sp. OMZ 792]UTC79216.1 ATP-binding protein [Treponema sp. OMZ 798]
MKIAERQIYLQRLISKMNNGMIKIITGVRRSGKSFLLFNLFYKYLLKQGIKKQNIITLAMDDSENSEFLNPEKLASFLQNRTNDETEPYFILLDEVQLLINREELKNKDSFIKLYGILNGLLRKNNVDVYVTGSNSKLLSSDVLTEFRGRGDEIHIAPLSFSEYYPVVQGDIYAAWNNYLMYGGMPYILRLSNDEEKVRYLTRLNSEIYLKDISERYAISNSSGMEELQKVISSSIGSLINPQKIVNTFITGGQKGISAPTIKDYLQYLQDAFLIQKAERYDVKGRKYITTPVKYYYADTGLRNAILGFRQFEETHLMENVIYNELIFRGFSVDVGVVEINCKENKGNVRKQLEVDFVANLGNRRYYIQSAFAIPDLEKMQQEQSSLLHVPDSFKKIIVVGTQSPIWRNEQGITIMSIYDFLLNENSLDV